MMKSEDPIKEITTSSATEAKKKKSKLIKFRKAPQAPKRFKSSFILFSMQKHPEIRGRLAKEQNSDVPNVAKLVSIEWKKLSDEDRAIWLKLAENDKKRFEMEKTIYTGPWKIPASKRVRKDPDAPKRSMSAFLAYSKTMRSTVKSENPKVSNTEVSKLLAVRWKEAPEDTRSTFIDQEAEERKKYKVAMAEWKTKNDKMIAGKRKEREDMATLAVEKGIGAIPPEFRPNLNVQIGQFPMQNMVHLPVINTGGSFPHSHGAPMYASYNVSYNTYRNTEFSHRSSKNALPELGTEIQTANQRLHDSSSSHAPSSNVLNLHLDQSKHMIQPEYSRATHQYKSHYEEGKGYGQPHEGRQHPSGYSQGGAHTGPWTNRNQWYPAEAPQYHAGYVGQEGAHVHQRGGYHEENIFKNQEGKPNNISHRTEYYSGVPGYYSYPQVL